MSGHATRHWRNQRLSAIALVLLGGWFLYSLLSLPDLDYGSVRAWLSVPLQSTLMLLFAWSGLWHSAQGVEVVVDDYVYGALHGRVRWVSRITHLLAAAAVAWSAWAITQGSLA